MSERQVQYDLLDEATRLADSEWPPAALTIPVLRALVERVQEAEAARQEWADLWQKASMSVLTLQDDAKTLTRERDAALGKLDAVRVHVGAALSGDDKAMPSGVRLVQHHTALLDVLAILDGKE